jgi:plastocyanin
VRSIAALGAIALLALSLAACSSSPSAGASTPPAAASTPPAAASTPPASDGGSTGDAVTIVDFSFQPTSLSVKAGTTVTWTQKDTAGHFVKWDDGTAPSSTLSMDQTYTRTFDTAGTFTYMCGIHGSMKGSVTVTP